MITSIKLEEKQIQIGDRVYTLRVNLSVLERIQVICGGKINDLLKRSLYEGNAITMAAMLNDWAEDQGWEQDWTEKKVKKLFTAKMMNMLDVTGMFFRAMTPEPSTETPKTEEGEPEDNSGN